LDITAAHFASSPESAQIFGIPESYLQNVNQGRGPKLMNSAQLQQTSHKQASLFGTKAYPIIRTL
jgi:hypothetical protein